MAINRGKQFEDEFKKAFKEIPNIAFERLYDPVGGYSGIKSRCDFILYKYPRQYYFELKSIHKNLFPLTNISDRQIKGLLEVSEVTGVSAGVVLWFCDHDRTIYISIEDIEEWKKTSGKKSINIKDIETEAIRFIELESKRKIALCTYFNGADFLDRIGKM